MRSCKLSVIHVCWSSLLFSFIYTVISTEECSRKWKGFGNSCYLFVTPRDISKSGWNDARKYCITKGADLVSITTMSEENFVFSHTKKHPYAFWIGLKYANTTDTNWAWSNGEKLNLTNWNVGEPNYIDVEHCVQILKKVNSWNNKECDVRLPWICEKPKTVKLRTTGRYILPYIYPCL